MHLRLLLLAAVACSCACSPSYDELVKECVPSGSSCPDRCIKEPASKIDVARKCGSSYVACVVAPTGEPGGSPAVEVCCQDASGAVYDTTGGCPAYVNGIAWSPCTGDALKAYSDAYSTVCK